MTCSEHVAIPVEVAERRGSRYWDPLATFGYLAARTERLRLATHVLVLGYHHPLEIAKRYGTLDVVSGGRLILGLGVGSLKEEFDLLGARFEGRGELADDALRALRASLGERQPAYRGPHFAFERMIVDPCALQQRVPIWIGGRTMRSLRRAVELGDGWVPFGIPLEEMGRMLARARESRQWEARQEPLEVVVWPEPPLDPLAEPDRARKAVRRAVEVGASMVNLRFVHGSRAHLVDQMARMSELVAG
jgi:probable F420-dependent oxidoreductase